MATQRFKKKNPTKEAQNLCKIGFFMLWIYHRANNHKTESMFMTWRLRDAICGIHKTFYAMDYPYIVRPLI